jgi:hypothetical protein
MEKCGIESSNIVSYIFKTATFNHGVSLSYIDVDSPDQTIPFKVPLLLHGLNMQDKRLKLEQVKVICSTASSALGTVQLEHQDPASGHRLPLTEPKSLKNDKFAILASSTPIFQIAGTVLDDNIPIYLRIRTEGVTWINPENTRPSRLVLVPNTMHFLPGSKEQTYMEIWPINIQIFTQWSFSTGDKVIVAK